MKRLLIPIGLTLSVYLLVAACVKNDDTALIKDKCTVCHNLVPVCSKLSMSTNSDWKEIINNMRRAGAKVSDNEAQRIVSFLSNSRVDAAGMCKP